MINTKELDGKIRIYFNKIYLGFAYLECDGFYVFMPEPRDGSGGFWSEHYLYEIHKIISEKNKNWNNIINANN